MSGDTIAVRDRAPRIRRGAARHFQGLGAVVLGEVSLANGRRADLVVLGADGHIAIVEIKSGLADLRADHKWTDYLAFCDRFYFAVDLDFPRDRLPEGPGVIVADAYEAEILLEPETRLLPAARRKAMTLRFARAAAARLQAILDPEGAPQLP